jgi:hypothetical protein
MPGLLKIGLTTRSVPDRVAELSATTGDPAAFRIEAYFESSDPQSHETWAHGRLAHRRLPGKEFFRVSVDEAIKAARAATGRTPLGQIKQLSPVQQLTPAENLADEGLLHLLQEETSRSGRAVPEIWRCSACLHSFFGSGSIRNRPTGKRMRFGKTIARRLRSGKPMRFRMW